MDLYRKLIISFCFLFSINNLIQSQVASDSVFCYLATDNKQNIQNAFSMKFFVHNASSDSIWIYDFNKYITNISAVDFRKTQERIFYWDLQTLSKKEPENVVNVSVFAPTVKMSKKQTKEQNVNIVISPNSTFVSDVYMLFSPFIAYPKGYYKLCLFDKVTGKCIAETVIEIE